MKRVRWMLARAPLGWPGLAAVALAVLAIAGRALWLPPMQERLEALARSPHGERSGAPRDAADLERFHRHFREADAVPAQLATLQRLAQAHGLALPKGEYRLVRGEGRFTGYEVTFPIAGPYPAVRAFLAQALVALPTAALEHVAFERKRVADSRVEAQLRLTIYEESR